MKEKALFYYLSCINEKALFYYLSCINERYEGGMRKRKRKSQERVALMEP